MTITPVPPVDVGLLREEIRKTYAAVSQEPERDFIFPTGRSWADDLDYPATLANVPESAVESFAGVAGVANPFSMGPIEPGKRVLDIGSGAGTDSLIAAQMIFSAIFRVLVPGGRIQIADVTIQVPVSEEGKRNIDLWTG